MKTFAKILLLIGLTGYVIFAILQFSHPVEKIVCQGVDVLVGDSTEESYLNEEYVFQILKRHKISPQGQTEDQTNLSEIEKILDDDPCIGKTHCYFTPTGTLCIQVSPLQPILHVMAQNGEEYYLDRTGEIMPIEHFNLDVCVATGHISKEYATSELLKLAIFLKGSEFWDKQIEQIHVVSPQDVSLVPRVGEHLILLGTIENLEDKFDRLALFYKKGLPKIGWNKYQSINLEYDNQIVCKKHETQ